jgi:hypothetical protein
MLRVMIGVILLAAASGAAQARPDFSGTWTAQIDTSLRPAPIAAYGPEFTIDHNDRALTVQRLFSGLPTTIDYVLDGSETRSRIPGRLCLPDSGATWTAAREDNSIVIRMLNTIPHGGGQPVPVDIKSVLQLEDSNTLRVSVTSQQANQAPRTNATVYKKKAAPSTPAVPVAPPIQKAKATLSQLPWSPGIWSGTNAAGTTFEERWHPIAGGSMIGVNRVVRADGQMSSFEFLCVVERDGGLVYQAMPGGAPPTDFTLTAIDATSATFENPAHSFPKTIKYTRREDGSLHAMVSGDANSRPLNYYFKRQN